MDNSHDRAWSWWYLLLLLQFVPALWVPFYNSVEPTLIGIPFFYWFQLVLVLVSAMVTSFVYTRTARNGWRRRRPAAACPACRVAERGRPANNGQTPWNSIGSRLRF